MARASLTVRTPVVTKPALSSVTPHPCSHSVAGSAPTNRKTLRIGASVSRPARRSRHRTPSRLPPAAPLQGDDLGLGHEFDVRRSGDAIDQVARHAFGQARSSDHHAHLGGVGGKEHRALTGRIAAADQNDLFAGAQARFDLRRPVPDPATLEPGDIGDRRMTIARAAGDDDRPSLKAIAALDLQHERAVSARAVERLDGDRNHDVGAKFLRLIEGAGGERQAAYAGRKAKVVFDPGAGPGLTAVTTGVENRDRQAFGGRVDRSRKARRPRADYGDVIDKVRLATRPSCRFDVRGLAPTDCRAPSRPGRPPEAIRRRYLHIGRSPLWLRGLGRIEQMVRIAVPGKKAIEPDHVHRGRRPD